MFQRLTELYTSIDEATLAQPQREAILDLLIWTMYVDKVLAYPENERLDELAEGMTWESVTPVSQYVNGSIARVRRMLDDDTDAATAFLDDLYVRLGDGRTRTLAFEAACELAESDGTVAEEERRFLEDVKSRFHIETA